MNELKNLYQEVILDHSKHPRHFHALDPCDHSATGHNPLCGDKPRRDIVEKMPRGLDGLRSIYGLGEAKSTNSAMKYWKF
ncbi:MAG: hypothetical protein ACFNT5_07645 [Cardiobacterium hominis]